jgi:hypothetical protein
MFSFLQQLVPKRREDLDADEDAYAESSAMPAFVPPAPLVKPPPTEEEIAEQEREAAEAEAREIAEREEAERLQQEALDEEKRRAEERLVERQERARVLLEERAAERQRREEAHLAAQTAALVAVPDLEPESESAAEVEGESEPAATLETHVVEDEAPALEEEVAPEFEEAHVADVAADVAFDAHVEHDEHVEHEEHVGRDEHVEYDELDRGTHAEDDADDFVFVPPAPEAEHVARVDSADDFAETADAVDAVDTVDTPDTVDAFSFVPPAAHAEAPVAVAEHVVDAEPVASDDGAVPLEPVVASEPHEQHVHAHVGAVHPEPAPAPVERYTWPATLLHHEHAMQYGEAARRNLISMIVELNDAKLARVLHDALYEERADGLRPDVLAALQRSYNDEELRDTYERFLRIGSEREREIAGEGLRSLDGGHA